MTHKRKRTSYTSQPAQDVKTTLFGRCYDVETVKQRCSNVGLTSC